MNLDLHLLMSDWHCPEHQICARTIRGSDGRELVQLRVDLGVLQMFADGRPDGACVHGVDTALSFVERELAAGRPVAAHDWQELHRELQQFNYRRLALCTLADTPELAVQPQTLREVLTRAGRDIAHLRRTLELVERSEPDGRPAYPGLMPTLVFSDVRVRARLFLLDGRVEDAIETLEAGLETLDGILAQAGADEETRGAEPGLLMLREQARHLRREHGVERTLREQLDEAVEREEFEQAARLRDALQRRDPGGVPPP